jgi:hypothetical protein
MGILSHLMVAVGHVLLWISTVLMAEELTLGGLARLLLSRLSRPSGKRAPARRRPGAKAP